MHKVSKSSIVQDAATEHRLTARDRCRRRHAVLAYDRKGKNWGDWNSSVERERLQREVELQRQRLQDLVQQQMRARPAWQTMLLPALGAGFFALLLGRHLYSAYLPIQVCNVVC